MEIITPCGVILLIGIYVYAKLIEWIYKLVDEIKKEAERNNSHNKKGGRQS
jgi:hypothetical protein